MKLYQSLRIGVNERISGVANGIKRDQTNRLCIRQSVRSKNSKAPQYSTTSSEAKALEVKAKYAELEARLAQLWQLEAAIKERERVRLMAEWVSANAVSKAYEDTIKEDNEQHLGSDDRNDEPVAGTHCQIGREGGQGSEANGSPLLGRGLNSQIANQPVQSADKLLKDPSNIYDEAH